MALNCTVKKNSITTVMGGLFNISLILECSDETDVVLTREFVAEYRDGDDMNDVLAPIGDAIQAALDDYAKRQDILAAANLDSAVNSLADVATSKVSNLVSAGRLGNVTG